MRKWTGAGLALAVFGGITVSAGELGGGRIRDVLAGNSIVSPDFGCVHYSLDGKTTTVDFAGNLYSGTWDIKDDLYLSSGRCGEAGCTVSGSTPNITFRSLDGEYVQPVVVVKGNFCEKNAVIS